MLELMGVIIWMIYINKICQNAGFRALRYNISVFTLWIFLSLAGKSIGYLMPEEAIIGELFTLVGFLLTVIISYTIIFTDIRTRQKHRSKLMQI
ncbi:MAG: hypothetical protein GY714_07945 [Desulfobacterales bacterium]|nr:hypothetical protein [Desulfobacterales bacterium]MCP4160451.1 hypothetical protein [Deltaproteobacteria bacterium]